MRWLSALSLLALAACGPSAPAPSAPAPQAQTPSAPAPTNIDLASLAGRIVAVGDRPQWRLDADGQLGLVLVMPEQGLTFSANFVAPTRTEDGGAQLVSAPLTVKLSAAPCASGGASFPMRAEAQIEQGQALTGCAFVRWDWRLTELLTAIDACIAKASTNRRVTYAAPDGDSVLVRLQGEAAPLDCRVGMNGAGARVTPADANRHIGGDGDAIFVRAPGENPGGQCYEAPEVRAPDGSLLGWMDDPQGC